MKVSFSAFSHCSGVASATHNTSLAPAAARLLFGFFCLSFFLSPARAQVKVASGNAPKPAAKVKAPADRKAVKERFDPHSVRSLKAALARIEEKDEEEKEREEKARKEPLKVGKSPRPGFPPPIITEEEEKDGADALGALLHYTRPRAYPFDAIDPSLLPRAAKHRDALPPARIGRGGNRQNAKLGPGPITIESSAQWEFLGPQNYNPPYQWGFGVGTMNGRVNEIIFDPNKTGTYYLASAGGGIWKTTDSGVKWDTLSGDWSSTQTYSVAVDPTNSNNVYAGTGDMYYKPGFGMMVSKDGGTTWATRGASYFGNDVISKIVVDPETPTTVLACAFSQGSQVSRSTDSGVTWKAVTPPDNNTFWYDLSYGAPDPVTTKRTYYAAGFTYNFNVSNWQANAYRSTDKGATWTKMTLPAISSSSIDRVSISAVPNSPSVVYLGVAYNGNTGRLFRSANNGATWTDITTSALSSASWGQSWYDFYVTASTRKVGAVTREVVYVGLIDILEYVYTGAATDKWVSIDQAYSGNDLVHVDQHRLAVDPADTNKILVGNDGGGYRMTYSGTAWTPTSLNASLGMTQFYAAAYHPTDALTMMGGAQDNGTSSIFGDPTMWEGLSGGDGGYCAIKQTNPNVYFTSSQGLNINYFNGSSWSNISPSHSEGTAFIAPFILDPSDQSVLYAGTSYLYRWKESTLSWENKLGGQKLSASDVLYAIAVAPSDSQRIYTGSGDGEVWMSVNRGATWTKINTGTISLPNRAISSIAVHPTNPNSILVGVYGGGTGHLWRCDDTTKGASRTWKDVSGSGANSLPDISLNTIALDLDDPAKTYYVGTDVGVMMTKDAGVTWTNATQPLGLPAVQVNQLVAVPGTRYLNAATFGRGIWRLSLSTVTNLVPTLIGLSPNQATAGSGNLTVTVTGTNFVNSTVMKFGGTAVTTTFVSDTQLTMSVPASLLTTAGNVIVIATNPPPGGGDSNALSFTINNPVPKLTSLTPSKTTVGSPATTITIKGTGFVADSKAKFGTTLLTTTFVSATELTATIPASLLTKVGTFNVLVNNPTPGGGDSAPLTFTVTENPKPTLTSISPNTVPGGSPATLITLTGTNFVAGSKAKFGATVLTTTFVSATQLTATIPASLLTTPGAFNVLVTNPAPGGGDSNAVTFTVTNNPAPSLTSMTPSQATAGAADTTVTLTGAKFVKTSIGKFNGVALTTTFVSATQLSVVVKAAQLKTAGKFKVAVTTPKPGGGTSNSLTFTVGNPTPTLTAISPSQALAGSGNVTISLTGTGFVAASKVLLNGAALTTTFVSTTKLSAVILASKLTLPIDYDISVSNAAPGGGTTASLTFTVINPTPTLTSISPDTATEQSATITLTLNGTGFVTKSVAYFNGTALVTKFVSATKLTATLLSTSLKTPGVYDVAVTNLGPGGGDTDALPFTVVEGTTALTLVSVPAPTVTRSGTNLIVKATIKNGSAFDARNVQVTGATLNVGNSSAISPASAFLIVKGGSAIITLTFPGTAADKGTTPSLTLTYTSKNAGSGSLTAVTAKVP